MVTQLSIVREHLFNRDEFHTAVLPYNRQPEKPHTTMNVSPVDYAALTQQALALTVGEADTIANMANVSALLFHALGHVSWVGFYRMHGSTLVLGPFQGKPACIRIPVGQGVCGAAAATRQTQRVDDVHAFAGHIACDPEARSELVIPVLADDAVLGVLDLDSTHPARFGAADATGLEQLVTAIGPAITADARACANPQL